MDKQNTIYDEIFNRDGDGTIEEKKRLRNVETVYG